MIELCMNSGIALGATLRQAPLTQQTANIVAGYIKVKCQGVISLGRLQKPEQRGRQIDDFMFTK